MNSIRKTQLEEISKELSRPVSVPADRFDSAGSREQIKEVLDKNECFRFSYSPVINDIILLREVFRFKSLKNIRRSTGLPAMIFLYTDSGWTIFYDDFKRKRISAAGFVTR